MQVCDLLLKMFLLFNISIGLSYSMKSLILILLVMVCNSQKKIVCVYIYIHHYVVRAPISVIVGSGLSRLLDS